MENDDIKKKSRMSRLIARLVEVWNYCVSGVWNDPRRNAGVRFVKTLNLSVNSFFDRGLQIKSMSLTYSTVLSIVPAFALIIAIGRGFGLQEAVQNELYVMFPSQHKVISTFLKFVDSYLTNASQGVFVGVGIIVLLWTVLMLLSGIEDAFNSIWDVKSERSIFQKFTDYITICLMVPILLICSSGLSIFMSDTVQNVLYFAFLTPVVNFMLELAPLILSWLAFSLSYWLIPNTRVSFKFAAISGAMAAIGFYVVQWLFINGQIYVSKYNAIYGSFAFLPLLLVWLQLSWLILLSGCVLTYSLQNIFTFNFLGDDRRLTVEARHRIAIIIMSIVAKRFINKETPLTRSQFASKYNLPVRVINQIIETLKQAGLLYFVTGTDGELGIAPACEVKEMTVADLMKAYNNAGVNELSPDFHEIYGPLLNELDGPTQKSYEAFRSLRLADLPIPLPEQIMAIINAPAEQ